MGSIPTSGSDHSLPVIAFDVDNTLLVLDEDNNIVTNEDVRALMVAIHKLGLARIMVWSGGGADYAEYATRDCGIKHMVHYYAGKGTTQIVPDITIDDQYMANFVSKVQLKLEGDIEPTPWMAVGQDNANV